MDTTFMNYGNSKTHDSDRLLPNLSDKINLKRRDICAALSKISIYYTQKNKKKPYKKRKI